MTGGRNRLPPSKQVLLVRRPVETFWLLEIADLAILVDSLILSATLAACVVALKFAQVMIGA
jgi:hypothetical protein